MVSSLRDNLESQLTSKAQVYKISDRVFKQAESGIVLIFPLVSFLDISSTTSEAVTSRSSFTSNSKRPKWTAIGMNPIDDAYTQLTSTTADIPKRLSILFAQYQR